MTGTEDNSKRILVNEISKISNINGRFHRISSMLLDHIIMTIVIVPPMMLIILASNAIFKFDNRILSRVFFSMVFIYVNKDFFNAKSPAKRILGYQVINRKTEKPATEPMLHSEFDNSYRLAIRSDCWVYKSSKTNWRLYCEH